MALTLASFQSISFQDGGKETNFKQMFYEKIGTLDSKMVQTQCPQSDRNLLYASSKALQQDAGTGDEGSSRRTYCMRGSFTEI